jgi:hypothetical protein
MLRLSMSTATIKLGTEGAGLGLPRRLTLGSMVAPFAPAAFYWRTFAP